MAYKIIVMEDAQADLDSILQYIIMRKKNLQAARSILDDIQKTQNKWRYVAESLPYCGNFRLRSRGYRRIIFYITNTFCCIV